MCNLKWHVVVRWELLSAQILVPSMFLSKFSLFILGMGFHSILIAIFCSGFLWYSLTFLHFRFVFDSKFLCVFFFQLRTTFMSMKKVKGDCVQCLHLNRIEGGKNGENVKLLFKFSLEMVQYNRNSSRNENIEKLELAYRILFVLKFYVLCLFFCYRSKSVRIIIE